jgi:hypothetical protein
VNEAETCRAQVRALHMGGMVAFYATQALRRGSRCPAAAKVTALFENPNPSRGRATSALASKAGWEPLSPSGSYEKPTEPINSKDSDANSSA